MRVCLVSREYPPDSGWGGIATYTYHHAHSLRKLGHDVEVIALAAKDARSGGIGKRTEDGIVVHRVAAEQCLTSLEMLRLSTPFAHYVIRSVVALSKAILQAHEEKPFDVAEAPEHLSEGLCPALTRLLPFVVRLHTPQSKLLAERFHNLSPSFDQEFVAMLERIAILSADVVTSPSEDMADYVCSDLGYARDKIQVIRNPVDVAKFSPDGERAITENNGPLVLFVGRLEERKGIHYLIRALPIIMSKFNNVKLVVIGADTNNARGQSSTLSELEQLVKVSGCAENVEFIPFVPLSRICDYYRSADICVVPSLYDNAPCTVLEGMASGKPIVTTDAGGSKEYVLDGESGYVVPSKNSDALANAIVKLLSDAEKARTMGSNGRERVLKYFHPEKLAQETVGVYKEAIANFAKRNAVSEGLYSRPSDRFMADTENMLSLYNQMLYDFLYANSWCFRIAHRVRRATALIRGKVSGG